MRSRFAFTLVEILVVISILMVIGSMAVPAIHGALGLVKRTACLSNLRQVGLAALAYAGDYEDQLPAERHFGTADPAASPAWYVRLPEYVDRTDARSGAFQCPAYRYVPTGTFAHASPKSLKWNACIDDAIGCQHYRLGLWSDEARVVLVLDAVAKETGVGQWGHCPPSAIDGSRHKGQINILCLDGSGQTTAPAVHAASRWIAKVCWIGGG